MFRTAYTVEVLKPIAIVAALAILLWSIGLPSLHADAASLTSVSDTVSDSAPSVGADHTITFTTPTGVTAGGTVKITFDPGFNLSNITLGDIDFASSTGTSTPANYSLAATASNQTWGVATSSNTITFTSGTAVLNPGTTVTIKIGKNATFGATGTNQILNPSVEGSYPITMTAGTSDTGGTRVVILSSVTVTAAVNTIFTFSVNGTGANTTVNGATTTGSTGSTTIPFGTLQANTPTTTAQQLSVSTNAANGYVVTVQVDGALQSSTGATIDGFSNGSDTNTPTAWTAPSGTLGSPNTYGHWAVTSDDSSIGSRTNQFGSDQWIAASTSPRAVMGNNGPANGAGQGVGTTTVGYRVEISPLQEAGDYSTTLTYVATPTF